MITQTQLQNFISLSEYTDRYRAPHNTYPRYTLSEVANKAGLSYDSIRSAMARGGFKPDAEDGAIVTSEESNDHLVNYLIGRNVIPNYADSSILNAAMQYNQALTVRQIAYATGTSYSSARRKLNQLGAHGDNTGGVMRYGVTIPVMTYTIDNSIIDGFTGTRAHNSNEIPAVFELNATTEIADTSTSTQEPTASTENVDENSDDLRARINQLYTAVARLEEVVFNLVTTTGR